MKVTSLCIIIFLGFFAFPSIGMGKEPSKLYYKVSNRSNKMVFVKFKDDLKIGWDLYAVKPKNDMPTKVMASGNDWISIIIDNNEFDVNTYLHICISLNSLVAKNDTDEIICTRTQIFEKKWDFLPIVITPDRFVAIEDPEFKPDDGRPEVPLAVYKKMVGHSIYAAPDFILETPISATKAAIIEAYNKKRLEWQNRNNEPESKEASQLIEWARAKLIAR